MYVPGERAHTHLHLSTSALLVVSSMNCRVGIIMGLSISGHSGYPLSEIQVILTTIEIPYLHVKNS
jgi:uncharacterized membrane protein